MSKRFSQWFWTRDFFPKKNLPSSLLVTENSQQCHIETNNLYPSQTSQTGRETCILKRKKLANSHHKGGFDYTLLHDQLSKQAVKGKRRQEPGQTKHPSGRSLASGTLKVTNGQTDYVNCNLTNLSISREDSFRTVKDKTQGVFCLISKYFLCPLHVCAFVLLKGECLALSLFFLDVSNLPN